MLHASIRENERRARLGDDQQAAAYWAGREQAFQEVLHRANRAALEYLQAWAGITRTGYHGTRIDGREPGRFEPAGLIVTSWLQGTSRDGDPQDHIHNQIARITRTFRDGEVARPGHHERPRGPRRAAGRRGHGGGVRADARVRRGLGPARRWARQRDPRRHAGADGRVFHAHGAGAREGTRARAGVGAQARPRADLARAVAHRQRRHPAITQRQRRGRDRLGRARAAVGRHPRRRTGRDRARGVGRARPRRTTARASRRPGADRTARARGPGAGIGQGPGPGVGPASGLDPARPAQAAGPRPACRNPADEPGGSPGAAVRPGRGGSVRPVGRGGVPGGPGVAAAARVAAPRAGRAQRLFASRRRAVRHHRAAVDGGAAGRARADARRAAPSR